MFRKRLAKWSALLAGTTLAMQIPGCDVLSGILEPLLGLVGGA